MAQKYVQLPGIGPVLLAKRRGSRNLRLTIRPDGVVRVGLPAWAPYAAGMKFALDRADWINSRLAETIRPKLTHGRRIGKSFRLSFRLESDRRTVATRISAGEIIIRTPFPAEHDASQSAALKASERALKKDAQNLLTIRLDDLAVRHGFQYRNFKTKKLRSRWGSCSSRGDIILNLYLIQLPWPLIDYVILHELVHTVHMDHSQAFWGRLEGVLPSAKILRKQIHDYRPDVMVQ